jgi:hypothetical protein
VSEILPVTGRGVPAMVVWWSRVDDMLRWTIVGVCAVPFLVAGWFRSKP